MFFYKCKICGKVVMMLDQFAPKTICCGQEMEELVANTTDGALEKHVPVVEEKDNKVIVRVGEIAHPMLAEHYINFIVLHTDQGYKIKHLRPGDFPIAEFAVNDNEIIFSAYEYCNLHGLWKKSIE